MKNQSVIDVTSSIFHNNTALGRSLITSRGHSFFRIKDSVFADNIAIYDSAVAYIESAGDEKYRQEDESYEPKEFLNFTFDTVVFHKN